MNSMSARASTDQILTGSPEAYDWQLDDEDLWASMTDLATLPIGSLDFDDLLTHVAAIAVRAIPGADGAGLTLLEEQRSDRVVATAPFVREIEEIQYSIGQGPCISAAAERKTMRSGSLGGDSRWSRFGARVARIGVHSVVSLPLLTPERTVGALNVYAYGKHAFDDRAVALGESFAVPAAITVQNAHTLAEARRIAGQLQRALETRRVIDQATGVIMSRSGGTEEQALRRLRSISQREHRKLGAVAQSIVEESVRRARAR